MTYYVAGNVLVRMTLLSHISATLRLGKYYQRPGWRNIVAKFLKAKEFLLHDLLFSVDLEGESFISGPTHTVAVMDGARTPFPTSTNTFNVLDRSGCRFRDGGQLHIAWGVSSVCACPKREIYCVSLAGNKVLFEGKEGQSWRETI